jgi:hypothetical protein
MNLEDATIRRREECAVCCAGKGFIERRRFWSSDAGRMSNWQFRNPNQERCSGAGGWENTSGVGCAGE